MHQLGDELMITDGTIYY
uniref:Uncharacterized protein n=1 Tax=Arundo donax TaxID=35708 RepID=A0A0A9CB80_ARUDO